MKSPDRESYQLQLDGFIIKTRSQQLVIEDLREKIAYLREKLLAQQGMLKNACSYIQELEPKVLPSSIEE